MAVFVIVGVLALVGMLLLAPLILPGAVVALAGIGVVTLVVRHRHPERAVHPH